MATSKEIPTKQLLQGAYEDPSLLYIHGLDPMPPGVKSEDLVQFFDPDRLIGGLVPGLVDSILVHGVNDAITVMTVRSSAGERKTIRVVVNGRQRVLAAREANRQLKEAKSAQYVRVPYVVQQAATAVTVAVSNEFRRIDSPIVKARRIHRMMKWNISKGDILASFASDTGHTMSASTMNNLLSLLKLPPEVQEKVHRGEIPPSVAYEMAKGNGAKVLAANGAVPSVAEAKAANKAAKEAPPASAPARAKEAAAKVATKPGAKTLAILAEKFTPTEAEPLESEAEEVFAATLRWITTGEIEGLDKWPSLAREARGMLRPSVKVGKEIM